MVLGCGFIRERRRAVFGVKFDVLKVRVFTQGVGVLVAKIWEPKSQSKICCFASNLAARASKFENIRAYRKFSTQILKFAS